MLDKVIDLVEKAIHLPQISEERCVHALIEQANCQACVQVCPQQAWQLDDDSLGLDTERCDGCGLCAAACPQQAIQASDAPVLRHWQGQLSAWCACEKTEASPGPYRIPCVHALSLQTLLKLYRQGCQQFFVSGGDCQNCPRGIAPHISERLKPLNQALEQRGYWAIEWHELRFEDWQTLYAQTRDYQNSTRLNRRQFLRRSIGQVADAGIQQVGLEETSPAAFGELLPESNAEASWPYVLSLNEDRCNGCDACVNLCPQKAIQWREECYRIEAKRCSGCQMCIDVCDQLALTMQYWQPSTQTVIPLYSSRCRACGVLFHYPNKSSPARELCRICRGRSHYKALYQVYD